MSKLNSIKDLVPEKPRVIRARRKPRPPNPVETANSISNDDFVERYIKPSEDDWPKWRNPKTNDLYFLSLTRPAKMSNGELNTCLDLVDETSGAAYRSSSIGWHVRAKRTEMRSPDLRYILIKDEDETIKGFTSMMPTFENGEPVVYCFEIHLKPELQGTGLGSRLMRYLMNAAENIPGIVKVMLTCFVTNDSGMKFYERLGFTTDDFSPRERKLRGGKTVKPDYVILSRKTATSRSTAADRHYDVNEKNPSQN